MPILEDMLGGVQGLDTSQPAAPEPGVPQPVDPTQDARGGGFLEMLSMVPLLGGMARPVRGARFLAQMIVEGKLTRQALRSRGMHVQPGHGTWSIHKGPDRMSPVFQSKEDMHQWVFKNLIENKGPVKPLGTYRGKPDRDF